MNYYLLILLLVLFNAASNDVHALNSDHIYTTVDEKEDYSFYTQIFTISYVKYYYQPFNTKNTWYFDGRFIIGLTLGLITIFCFIIIITVYIVKRNKICNKKINLLLIKTQIDDV